MYIKFCPNRWCEGFTIQVSRCSRCFPFSSSRLFYITILEFSEQLFWLIWWVHLHSSPWALGRVISGAVWFVFGRSRCVFQIESSQYPPSWYAFLFWFHEAFADSLSIKFKVFHEKLCCISYHIGAVYKTGHAWKDFCSADDLASGRPSCIAFNTWRTCQPRYRDSSMALHERTNFLLTLIECWKF